MSDLDIAERRAPQDGRVALTLDGRRIDVRVATLPLVAGESVVLRVLDKDSAVGDLDALGIEPEAARPSGAPSPAPTAPCSSPVRRARARRRRSTARCASVHTPEKNIITIEDPVEYQLAGINQMQVNPKAGLTFGSGLRSMLRADPDVIMVGEIRDQETAQIAIQAALTGHLVLSTLHTNDAPSAVTRLIDMGIEPFLVASAVDCVVAQRLARTLCQHCARPVTVPGDVVRSHGYKLDADSVKVLRRWAAHAAEARATRAGSGSTRSWRSRRRSGELVVKRASADTIAAAAVRAGMHRLREDGLAKVLSGRTSFAEIARVTG